jgi:hypothetical protein
VSDPGFGGLLLGRLGLLDARAGRFEEARRRLDEGEDLLRAASQPLGLADVRVDRAEVEHLAGAREAAEQALAEAASLAAPAGPDSPIARRIDEVRRNLQLQPVGAHGRS